MSPDRWWSILRLRARTLFHRSDVERDLDDELRDHIERQTAENIRRGMNPPEARTAALRALGGVEHWKENVRDTRGTRGLEELVGDLGVAVRSLRRTPGFTLAVIVTLALGIGANTAMFTVLRGTLLRPLPHRDGERLIYLRQSAGTGRENLTFSVPEVARYRASARTLAAIAEYSTGVPFTVEGPDGNPKRVSAGVVSGNYFDVMGLQPVLGRLTSAVNDGPAAAPVVVLSHQFWTDHFGADSSVVGRTIRLNDLPVTILGVAQRVPQYPRRADVYINMVVSPHHLSATMVTERTHRMTEVFARLAPGASVEEARAELTGIAAAMMRDHPESYASGSQHKVTVAPLRLALNERASFTFWLLMGASAFVLLIACSNVANLTLMRGVGRQREMLVRQALGAGTARLRRMLLVENLVLALTGGALGVVVALAGLQLLVAFASQLSPRAQEIRVDGLVLAFGLVVSLVAALGLSFVPRVGGDRTSLASSLAPSGRRSTLGRAGKRFQQSLVAAQLAVSLVLLTGAGLLVRTLGKLQAVEPGVRVERVLTLDLPLDGDFMRVVMRQPENLARFQQMRDRVAALPGVDEVALGTVAPLRSSILDFDLVVQGRPRAPDEPVPHASVRSADPDYFRVSGIPVLAGRGMASTDRRGSPAVVVLNASLARMLFGESDPIGQRVALSGAVLRFTPFTSDWRTVVGVVGDTRDNGVDREPTPTMYLPFAQEFIVGASLVVRTTADPGALQPAIMRAVREVSPRQLIENVTTLEQAIDARVAPRQLNALFIATFATLALVIAMVGIAGVLASSVSSRTSEFGIRMSLGATGARVRRMVLGEGGALLAVGLSVGMVGAVFAARLLRGLLWGVTPNDPITLGGVAILLAAVGLAACWIPAVRASRVDPAVALRAD